MKSRTFPVLLSCLAVILAACLLLSCGGAFFNSNNNQQGPFNVVGNWQVGFSTVVGAKNSGSGAIDSAGVAAFFDAGGNIFQLPAISGASSFSGNLNAYAVNADPFSGGNYILTGTAQGTVASSSSVSGSYTISGTSGTFTVTPYTPLSSALVPLSGFYNAKFLGYSDVVDFMFASDGTFTGSDNPSAQVPGCSFTGALTQQGTTDVFDVTYATIASNSCTAATETGIAFESKTDYFNVNGGIDATYFYIIMLTSSFQPQRPFVAVVYQ